MRLGVRAIAIKASAAEEAGQIYRSLTAQWWIKLNKFYPEANGETEQLNQAVQYALRDLKIEIARTSNPEEVRAKLSSMIREGLS